MPQNQCLGRGSYQCVCFCPVRFKKGPFPSHNADVTYFRCENILTRSDFCWFMFIFLCLFLLLSAPTPWHVFEDLEFMSLCLRLWIYFTSSSSWGRIDRLRRITCFLFRLHKCKAQLKSGSATMKLSGSSICLIPFPFSISVCLSPWSLYSKLFFCVRSRLWDHRGLNENSQWDYYRWTRDGRMGSKSEEFSNWVWVLRKGFSRGLTRIDWNTPGLVYWCTLSDTLS